MIHLLEEPQRHRDTEGNTEIEFLVAMLASTRELSWDEFLNSPGVQ